MITRAVRAPKETPTPIPIFAPLLRLPSSLGKLDVVVGNGSVVAALLVVLADTEDAWSDAKKLGLVTVFVKV